MPRSDVLTNCSIETQSPVSSPHTSSRRDVLKTGARFFVIGGLTLGFAESGQLLQVIFPGPMSQETATTRSNEIIVTAEQLKNGVNLVVFGDSIPRGFQGYTFQGGNRIENPSTSFAKFMGKAVEASDIGTFNVDVRAAPGATGEDIYRQVVEYHNQISEAKKQGTFKNRPTLFLFSMNGNSYRTVLSQPEAFAQAQTIDHQGFLHPELLNLIPPFDTVSQQDKRYALRAFNEMAQMSQEGLQVLGLTVLGPYDFGGVPSMEFIPTENEQSNLRAHEVPITVFNLQADENARRGAHIVSLSVNKSLVEAYNMFHQLPVPFPTEFISMLGLEQHNNGTEHLNTYGCFLLACLVMSHIKLQLKFGRKVNLLTETNPIAPLPEIQSLSQHPAV